MTDRAPARARSTAVGSPPVDGPMLMRLTARRHLVMLRPDDVVALVVALGGWLRSRKRDGAAAESDRRTGVGGSGDDAVYQRVRAVARTLHDTLPPRHQQAIRTELHAR